MTSAFTPLIGASLLHVAAEFGHLDAARVLIEAGADVEARAAVDEFGLNGHTPISHGQFQRESFRAVAQSPPRFWREDRRPTSRHHVGQGVRVGDDLCRRHAHLDVQLGLLPQVHRRDRDVYANIKLMLKASGRAVPLFENVPNRYLEPK